jgi:hypothetical protein
MFKMGREGSHNECDDSNIWERGLRSQSSNYSEVAISCDPDPNRVFENRKAGGENLVRENAPFAFS